jgi:hypothetical protein
MGADGFFANITETSGATWNRYLTMVDAAVALGTGFYVVPMIDTNGGTMASKSPTEIASALKYFVGKSSSYMENGKFLVSCFYCEYFSVQRWTDIFLAMTAITGVPVTFAGILLDNNEANIRKYAPICRYLGGWMIGADPAILNSTNTQAAYAPGWARSAGCGWVGTGHTQINVPYTGHYFDEACNSRAMRASWDKIIRDNSDHVQNVTWCDFSEGGQIAPSVAKGWCQLAISAYYIQKWKYGLAPVITKDVLFLSHRDQPLTGATYQSMQTEFMTQVSRPVVSPLQDAVEVLTYLRDPATIHVTIGGVAQTPYTAPAGEFSRSFVNALGSHSASFSRKGVTLGSVTSPFRVTKNPMSQDRQYFFSSTLETSGQYYPMMSY